MAQGKIELDISSDDKKVAYVSLPAHPAKGTPGCVKKHVRFLDVYPGYQGPDLFLDFDDQNQLIGIEIIG